MPKKGSSRRKRKTQKAEESGDVDRSIPRSIVLPRGPSINSTLRGLIVDLRTMLLPHTAMKLKARQSTSMADYLGVAAQLGVTHFWLLSSTDLGVYLRIARAPRGPTLRLKILKYSLAKDIIGGGVGASEVREPPLLVLSNFEEEEIMAAMFTNMFPAIDVRDRKTAKRVVLVDYSKEEQVVCIRHYAIRVGTSVGLSRVVRKVGRGQVPKLGGAVDISDVVSVGGGSYAAESEADSEGDGEEGERVDLAAGVAGVRTAGKRRVKLREIGPRIEMQLMKVEDGFCGGEVIYHRLVEKTKKEKRELERRKAEKDAIRAKRRKNQMENVERKKKRRGRNAESTGQPGSDD